MPAMGNSRRAQVGGSPDPSGRCSAPSRPAEVGLVRRPAEDADELQLGHGRGGAATSEAAPRGCPAWIRSRLLGKLPATSRRLVTNLAQGLPERAKSLSEDGVFVGKVGALQFLKRSPGSREGGDRLLHRSVKALICCIAAGSGHSGSIRPLAVRWRAGGPRPPGSLGP